VGIEHFDLKAVRSIRPEDEPKLVERALELVERAPEPVEQATVPSVSGASASELPEKPDRGNEAVRGILFGVGFGLLLWGLLVGVAVALVMVIR
jgi:hypothetical protein